MLIKAIFDIIVPTRVRFYLNYLILKKTNQTKRREMTPNVTRGGAGLKSAEKVSYII